MVFEFKDYGLTDVPFVDLQTLQPYSVDPKENGQIYVNGATKEVEERVLSRIKFGDLVTYVASTGPIKGTGKSALMAHLFWELQRQHKPSVWTDAQGERSPGGLVGRIFDSILSFGLGKESDEAISKFTKDATEAKLKTIIGKSEVPSLAKINGLMKVLQAEKLEQSTKLANIRRSIVLYGPLDIFGYYLKILKEAGIGRITVFIDQFEDYIQAQSPSSMQKLSDDWRTLLGSLRGRASIIVSMHGQASVVMKKLTNYKLAEITGDSQVIVPALTPERGVRLAGAYLAASRVKGFKDGGNELNPFEKSVIEYFTKEVDGNPRRLMSALRTTLRVAMEQEMSTVDLSFVKSKQIQQALRAPAE